VKLPRPLLIAVIALGLVALFMFLNDQPVRVSFLVTGNVMPVWAVILISFLFGLVPGLSVGWWLARTRKPRI